MVLRSAKALASASSRGHPPPHTPRTVTPCTPAPPRWQAAAREGKQAEALVAALPARLKGCLQHEPPPPAPAHEAAAAAAAAAAGAGDATGSAAQPAPQPPAVAAGVLPPCVPAQRALHGPPVYQLQYRLHAQEP